MNVLLRWAAAVITVAAAAVLSAILLTILVIGLDALASAPVASGLAGLFAPIRSYLFRNALRNTLIVLAVALPLACLLGLAASTLMARHARSRGVMTWLLLLPLAMPVAMALPAWRQLFAASPAPAGDVLPVLAAIGVIQAWRILPLATLFLLLARPLQRRRIAVGATLCFGAYVVFADVGVVLLLTGGEPFNATHQLASWTYQIGIAGAMPEQAATVATVLAVILAGCSWGGVHFAGKLHAALQELQRSGQQRVLTSTGRAPQPFGRALLAVPAMFLLLLPLAVTLPMAGAITRWPAVLGELFGRLDYGYWLVNTLLLAGVTALVTVLVAIPAGRRLATWQSPWSVRLSTMAGILGMTALPVLFVPLAWLQRQGTAGDGRWLLGLVYASAALCIGAWLVALMSRGARPIPRSALAGWLVLLSFLLATHEMAGALALSNGMSRTQSLNSGLTTRLAYDALASRPTVGVAILLPTALLWIFYRWLVSRSVTSLVESPTEEVAGD